MQHRITKPLSNPEVKALYQKRAEIIKSLAHPTRAYLVDVLSSGERCVCELVELVGADFSTVSKHLSLLRSAGVVTCRKEGLQVFYALRSPCILTFLKCIEEVRDLDLKELSSEKKTLRIIR